MYFQLMNVLIGLGVEWDPPQARDIQERVRDIVGQHFLELPDPHRKIYVDKIVLALQSASSAQRLEDILVELPKRA